METKELEREESETELETEESDTEELEPEEYRTVEEVQKMIEDAKLDPDDLEPITQVLNFSSNPDADRQYKFLEVDTTLLGILQQGQRLIFKGSEDENIVLCTDKNTYEVKEAETSNSLVLVPGLLWANEVTSSTTERELVPKEAIGVFHKYIELKLGRPKLQKLWHLLEESRYKGPEHEEELQNSGIKFYTFQDLLEEVQSSEQELNDELSKNLICRLGDYWRLLDNEYHFRVLCLILGVVDENSWPVDGVNRMLVLESLTAIVPADILDQCFLWYTEEVKGAVNNEDESLYKLREERICRFLAESLLRPAGKFLLKDFFSSWQQSVPEGLQTSEKYLAGLAIVDRTSKPEIVWYFPENDLPEDINERFKILFHTKEKWTLEEIKPYIEKLTTPKMNVNGLLTKFARAFTIGGVRYYGAKHGK